MAAWSSMLRCTTQKLTGFTAVLPRNVLNNGQLRCMAGHARTMPIRASSWQWQKTKDWLHFYVMLGVIPMGILVFCSYVFVGPATLEPIPEGYVPKHWEYYQNPITRFIARYLNTSPQQEYEKYLHVIYYENENIKVKKLESRVDSLMAERKDYRHFYVLPVAIEPLRLTKDEKLEELNAGSTDEITDI